ncbi:hypothetical protein DVH24_039919 [Malus domestica]|uniref:ADP-ribosyl cyclase/cyclic ADP-ribose hydrolase n=1 Tax=Malus domestica TaxID=3750 RepID=A0A498I2B7_MALDO|nr:hypothetical protein DVH24_039919 [Malus domestica]
MQPHNTNSTDELWKYDVYLSFKGSDTDKKFTDHLRNNLHQRGFRVFRDDDELPRRREDYRLVWYCSALKKNSYENKPPHSQTTPTYHHDPSKESRSQGFFFIVFSKNYASSPWCLDELVKILESRDSMAGQQIVMPIFYKVQPSDVRNQRGSFEEAFSRYEGVSEDDLQMKLLTWRNALRRAAELTGWPLDNGYAYF